MEHTASSDIALAASTDAPTLSDVLARAFQDDPVFAWVVPDPARRRARLPAVFAVFAEFYLRHNETYIAADRAGAALWAPPGVEPVPEEHAEAFGERITAILGDDADRGWEVTALLAQHHPAEPSFYLQFVGVAPEHQGRGIGSRLLVTVLQRCDAAGTPAYLEATSVHNRRLYQRHGFETVGELRLPDGPVLWPMWREPAVSAHSG